MKESLSFVSTLTKGERVSERLEVHINNTYDENYKDVSTAQVWDDNRLVSEWKTSDPRALLYQGIESADPDPFQQIKIKKILEKAAQLFEPTTISVISKQGK